MFHKGDTSPVAVCDLGHARPGTRGKHSADVILPLRSSFKLRRADDKKNAPRAGVYFLLARSRRRDEEGRVVLLSCVVL